MELRFVLHIHTHISALSRNTVPLHTVRVPHSQHVRFICAALSSASAALHSHSLTVPSENITEENPTDIELM